MQNRKRYPWFWVVLSAVVVLAVVSMGLVFMAVAVAGTGTGKQVALIELSGLISDEGTRGVLGGSVGGARKFIADCEKAERDPNVKAVVIRIDSPGGAAAAAQEMYRAVVRLKAKKPVICSMGDVAASGGYYVAAACEKIYANGSTMTGSIGVISEFLNYGKLFDKLGVDQPVVKSGKFKDAGNPARPMTADERDLFQSMIMNVYAQFVDDVAAGRKGPTAGKLTRSQVLKLADGRVYTGLQAKDNGLVDEIGGLREAIDEAANRGGIKGEPHIKNYSSSGLLDSLSGGDSESTFDHSISAGAQSAGQAFADGFLMRLRQEPGTIAGTSPLQAR